MKTFKDNKFTALHRILHWIIAFSMFILFLTGFLRMEWMNKKVVSTIIETKAATENISLSAETLKTIVKSIQAPMWEWHEITAYVILIAFIIRVLYSLINGFRFPNPFSQKTSAKNKFQSIIYILIYFLIFCSIITGFYLKWGNGDYKSFMEPIHKWAIYWFPIFIIIHFSGIVIGELTNKKGITSKMIGGD